MTLSIEGWYCWICGEFLVPGDQHVCEKRAAQIKIEGLEKRVTELEYRLSLLSKHVDWVYEEGNK